MVTTIEHVERSGDEHDDCVVSCCVEDVCRKFSVLGDTPVSVVVVASNLVVDW